MRESIPILLIIFLMFNGCAADKPLVNNKPLVRTARLEISGASAYKMVILSQKKYPDIRFDKPAPVTAIYRQSFNIVWNSILHSLKRMHENIDTMNKNSGVIRAGKKNLYYGPQAGKRSEKEVTCYELNISVKKVAYGISVHTTIPFGQQKLIVSNIMILKKFDNAMRHIFYRGINTKIQPSFVCLANNPSQSIIYAKYASMIYRPVSTKTIVKIKGIGKRNFQAAKNENKKTTVTKRPIARVKKQDVKISRK